MSLERESSFEGFSQKELDICNSYIVAKKKKLKKQASDMNFRHIVSLVFQAPIIHPWQKSDNFN